MNYDSIWQTHLTRRTALADHYDPILGRGCIGPRVDVPFPGRPGTTASIPASMLADPLYPAAQGLDWQRLRCRHDFEYWCARCVTIKDKLTGADIPFRLNAPQRRVAAILEMDRLHERPLRLIMLKARQWGGSTLVQMYMAWIQTCLRRNWNSLICAHVKDTAATIRGMYSRMIAQYPRELWDGDAQPRFQGYERSVNVREIAGRGCRVTLGSSENQEAVRGADYAMAHLSEVAFWTDSPSRSPEKFIRAVCGAIALVPLSLIAMESTANGVGNFFHREWCRSKSGQSDKRPIFVPWYEIEIYRQPISRDDFPALWDSLDTYERALWDRGLTLDMINWYHNKRREYPCHSMMQAEYPTDDTEAFANTGHNIFPNDHVERLRQLCRPPALVGELAGLSPVGQGAITSIRFSPSSTGLLKIWETPRPGADRYVTAVDIGGRSAASDYSVIAVFDRLGPKPAVVAQWRGHLDHDLLTWKAATIAAWYNNALLVIESNTLETENTEGDNSLYILSRLRRHYSNLYIRGAESEFESTSRRIGFHTNRATKSLIINDLIARVRDGQYIERDNDACDELAVYQLRPDGSTGAREGCHDDILMTRAIALYVIRDARPPLDIDDLRRYLRNTRLTYLTAPARDTAPRPSIP